MAIGTAAAIGLGVAGVGSVLGAKSANKASKRAAQVSADNNAQNTALQRDIYNQNKQILNPYVQRGNAAGETMNALLGLGGGAPQQPAQQPQVQPNALSQFMGGFERGNISSAFGYGIADGQAGLGNPYNITAAPTAGSNPLAPQAGGVAAPTPQDAANNAFDIYRGSTGYQFRLGEGMNALNSGYAGAGVLQSGDAMRAATEYGQNFASNEFGNYMGYLGNQQGVGLSAGSAVAGVGQNYANNITQMNTQNAANQANAITSRQNPLANVAGLVGGGLFGFGTGAL